MPFFKELENFDDEYFKSILSRNLDKLLPNENLFLRDLALLNHDTYSVRLPNEDFVVFSDNVTKLHIYYFLNNNVMVCAFRGTTGLNFPEWKLNFSVGRYSWFCILILLTSFISVIVSLQFDSQLPLGLSFGVYIITCIMMKISYKYQPYHPGYRDRVKFYIDEVMNQINKKKPKFIIVTGHSLGGGLAQALVHNINSNFKEKLNVYAVTFASSIFFRNPIEFNQHNIINVRDTNDLIQKVLIFSRGKHKSKEKDSSFSSEGMLNFVFHLVKLGSWGLLLAMYISMGREYLSSVDKIFSLKGFLIWIGFLMILLKIIKTSLNDIFFGYQSHGILQYVDWFAKRSPRN